MGATASNISATDHHPEHRLTNGRQGFHGYDRRRPRQVFGSEERWLCQVCHRILGLFLVLVSDEPIVLEHGLVHQKHHQFEVLEQNLHGERHCL